MDTYTLLREFADSWGLLLLVAMFLGVVLIAFRPGSKDLHRDMASLPLRKETPGPDRGKKEDQKA